MTMPRYAFPDTSTIRDVTLDNGVRVLVYENPTSASVVLYSSVLAGSVYEPRTQTGVASMTAALLLSGTQTRDFDTFNETLENIGAELDTNASKHRVTISGRSLAEDFDTLLDMFTDALCHPAFDPAEVDEERAKRLTELQYARQDTRYMAGRTFRETLYPENHPYHHSTYGTLKSLPSLTADDLRAFHEQMYSPQGMLLVVVGAVDSDQTIATLQEKLGTWQTPQTQLATVDLPVIPELSELVTVETDIAGKTQADIVLGVAGPSRLADDYLSAQIANSILGEFGMMGRVGNIIREQLGLAYYAYSRLDGGIGRGAWTITAGVSPENVPITIEKARAEITRLTDTLASAIDLEDNQSYFTGRLPLRLESNYGLASTIHAMVEYELGLDYLVQYRDHIFSITREDVRNAAAHYLHADKLVVSVAG
ncbi:MAG: pitrilysin family protein [Chloroflexota bacterium]